MTCWLTDAGFTFDTSAVVVGLCGPVLFSSTPTEPCGQFGLSLKHRFVTIASGRPSPFTSAIATKPALTPPELKVTAGWKVPSPFPKSAPTKFVLLNDSIRSGFPSPFISAIATELVDPTGNVSADWKVPLPLPSSTPTVPAEELVTTKSILPSPFTSAPATKLLSPPEL